MSKKRSLIALLILAVSALTVCCLLSCRIYADADTTFDAFTDALFQEEVNSNSITLHYTLQNPDNYGIDVYKRQKLYFFRISIVFCGLPSVGSVMLSSLVY